MIADTSAIIAILRAEDDAADYARAIAAAVSRRLSAAGHLEWDRARFPADPIVSRSLDELVAEA